MLRIEARCDHDPLTAMRAFGDREQRLDYDQNVHDCYATRMVGCNLFECVQITKSALGIIKSRDFFQYFFIKINKDKSRIKIVGRDI